MRPTLKVGTYTFEEHPDGSVTITHTPLIHVTWAAGHDAVFMPPNVASALIDWLTTPNTTQRGAIGYSTGTATNTNPATTDPSTPHAEWSDGWIPSSPAPAKGTLTVHPPQAITFLIPARGGGKSALRDRIRKLFGLPK